MKLLCDLNIEQSKHKITCHFTKRNFSEITMVMVTHDVQLKNFADRVVWMRDGKIQRIEKVPTWKKEEAIK